MLGYVLYPSRSARGGGKTVLKQGLKRDPTHANGHEWLSQVQRKMGKTKEADESKVKSGACKTLSPMPPKR